jgi:hypothetical protein
MKLFKSLVLAVSLLTGVGTAGGVGGIAVLGVAAAHAEPAAKQPDKQPATKQMSDADVTRWLAFFDKLVATVAKPSASCDKLAVDVSVVIDQNKDAIEIARTARASGKKLPEAAQQHMLEGVKKMVPAMQKCGQHDKVRAAFAKLDLNRRG